MKIYNRETCEFEKAKENTCPRCKGHGKQFGDDEECFLCDGKGTVIRSDSGWTRPLNSAPNDARTW